MTARIFSLVTNYAFLLRFAVVSLISIGSALAASVGSVPAQTGIELPRTMAWSAYPTGTGGYSQAVALGNILQRTYGVNLRVIPGRNDVSRLATL